MDVQVGKTASVTTVVNDTNTAAAMRSGALPVFATPSMAALMERAACECLAGCLDDGHTSVGTALNIKHTAASPISAAVTATAKVVSVDGSKIEFEVAASDDTGEIGRGSHTRRDVDAERFMKKSGRRKG
jgi:predicted thioesterase